MDKNNIASYSQKQLVSLIGSWPTDKIIILIDSKVYRIQKKLQRALQNLGKNRKNILLIKVPAGEKAKTFKEYQRCCELIIASGIHRQSLLVAIGGGATTDLGGFVAATLLRGIPWIAVPTTLLAMIDASLGGKTAINSIHGKNLIGSFHLPQKTVLIPSFLETLSEKEKQNGLGEFVKYLFLDQKLMKNFLSGKSIEQLIGPCAQYKMNIVSRDFYEKKERKWLNFGHTFGHAFEKEYKLAHGEAVIWGMAFILAFIQDGRLLPKYKEILNKLGWKRNVPPWEKKGFDTKKIFGHLTKDKKMTSNKEIDLILVEKIGHPVIRKTKITELIAKVKMHESAIGKFNLY